MNNLFRSFLSASRSHVFKMASSSAIKQGIFKLEPLPYPSDGLAPHISKDTLEVHHGGHHATYITKLNDIVANSSFKDKTLEEICRTDPTKLDAGLFNNAAQSWNHAFYWKSMAPPTKGGGGVPKGKVADLIKAGFGDFDKFKAKFEETAAKHFGSGWTWVVFDKASNSIKVVDTHDAANPLKGS